MEKCGLHYVTKPRQTKNNPLTTIVGKVRKMIKVKGLYGLFKCTTRGMIDRFVEDVEIVNPIHEV